MLWVCRGRKLPLAIVKIGFRDYSQRLFEYFPQFNGLVCEAKAKARGWMKLHKSGVKLRKEQGIAPFVDKRKCAAFCRLHHLILLIFSSISRDLR